MLFNNFKECKKYFKEYRYIRNTMNKYIEYEKNQGLNEQDTTILTYMQNKFISMSERINSFINDIEDTYVKQIFCMHFLSGYTWEKIAIFFGGVASCEAYRKTVERYFNKYFNSEL